MARPGNGGWPAMALLGGIAVGLLLAGGCRQAPPPSTPVPPAPEVVVPWQGLRPPRPSFPAVAPEPAVLGPFHLQPVCSVYLVHDGTPAWARGVAWRGHVRPFMDGERMNRIMLRVFDADERLTHWQYGQTSLAEPVVNPRDEYAAGLAALPIIEPDGDAERRGQVLVDGSFALVGAGVHQVRMNADQVAPASLMLSRHFPHYGVSCQNGWFTPWGGSPRTLYAWVPPRAESLTMNVRRGPIRILDDDGGVLFDSAVPEGARSIPVTKHETIWTFELPQQGHYEFMAWGFPLILCSTRQAAAAIRASVEVLDDGTVVCHKFQRRIAELLPTVLAPERMGKAEDLIVPLQTREEAWLADPLRHVILCGYSPFLRGVHHALAQQNVDQHSRWGGLFIVPEPAAAVAPEQHRWDNFLPVAGIGGARNAADSAAWGLALAAVTDSPINPYFGKTELLWRAAAADLRHLLKMDEAEIWPESARDPYPSGMSFTLGQKTVPAFGVAAPHLPPEIREIWTEGVRRLIDRAYANTLVTCRNQSSHSLVYNEEYAHGSGDPVATRLSRIFARHFAAGANAPGYHHEACGPCGSYIGMTHWHMGVYWRMSRDEEFRRALEKSYCFFNHTVAPEPDGRTILGGFNFNHRIAMGFMGEQWGGAKGIADDLAEVALHCGRPLDDEELAVSVEKAKEQISRELSNPRAVFPGSLTTPRWQYYTNPPNRAGVWPALETESFIRNFNDELFAIKRPGYYTCVYAGRPTGGFYIRSREKFRPELPGELEGGTAGNYGTPMLGGGLSFFWTPAGGTSLLATNQTPLAHHGLVAWDDQGHRWWEDYEAQRPELDETTATLAIAGRVEGRGLDYRRQYVFHDHHVEVIVAIVAQQDVKLARLVECLPFIVLRQKDNPARRGEAIVVAGENDGKAVADRFRFVRDGGQAVEVILDQPREMTVRRDGFRWFYDRYQSWRVEVELPTVWQKGQTLELRYRIGPGEY